MTENSGRANQGWIQNPAGLYVPPSSILEDPISSESPPSQHSKKELRAVWVQALAAVLALVLGVPGVWLAYKAFTDQQEINRSQIELNQLAQNRFERRYAAKFAFWDEVRPFNKVEATFKLQNRSPVPLRHVTIVGKQRMYAATPKEVSMRLWFELPTIPPCSLAVVEIDPERLRQLVPTHIRTRIEQLDKGDHSSPYTFDWDGIEYVEFRDPVGRWSLSAFGMQKQSPLPGELPGQLPSHKPHMVIHIPALMESSIPVTIGGSFPTFQQIEDCSEAG